MQGWKGIVFGGCLWSACGLSGLANEPLGAFPPETLPDLPLVEVPPEPLAVRVYPVADLVVEPEAIDAAERNVPVESGPQPVTTYEGHASARQRTIENLSELSMIVQSTVAPESWEMAGGPGRIAVHDGSRSLVIRQTAAVHAELAEMLSNLSHESNIRIELSWHGLVSPLDSDTETDEVRMQEMRKVSEAFARPLPHQTALSTMEPLRALCKTQPTMRLELKNGHPAELGPLMVTAVMSADRRTVQLHLSSPAEPGRPRYQYGCTIPDGHTVLLPVNWCRMREPVRTFISIDLAIPEEEEELLPGTPLDDHQLLAPLQAERLPSADEPASR